MNRNDHPENSSANEQPDKEPKKRWLDLKEASKMLNMSPRTLRDLKDNGKIAFVQEGSGKLSFDIYDLDNYMEMRKRKK